MAPLPCSNDDGNAAIIVFTNLANGEVTSLCPACVPPFFVEMARQMPGVRVMVDESRQSVEVTGEAGEAGDGESRPTPKPRKTAAKRTGRSGPTSPESSDQPTDTGDGEATTEPPSSTGTDN